MESRGSEGSLKGLKVVVAEDDLDHQRIVRRALERQGCNVQVAGNGEDALRLIQAVAPGLVVLDLRLPDLHGDEVCQRMRAFSATPVIMMSGIAVEVEDRIRGLDSGADDYLVKPFSLDELVARTRAVMRRSHDSTSSTSVSADVNIGCLLIDSRNRLVLWRGVPVSLTNTEFSLLAFMAKNPNRLLRPAEIVDAVWGSASGTTTDCLKSTLSRLRKKIERCPSKPEHVITRRGLGYVFVP